MEMPVRSPPRKTAFITVANADRARRSEFLRVANRCWLGLGGIAMVMMHFYPTEQLFFLILIASTILTFGVVELLNRRGWTRVGGWGFCLVMDATIYGLLLLNYRVHGFRDLESTMTGVSAYAFMGASIVFAGAVIGARAAFAFALLNTILLSANAMLVDSRLGPKISIPCFWWILAIVVWLYERHVHRALGWLREAQDSLELKVVERTRELDRANSELESFSYSVAHDLRAPLRRIAGFAEILEEDEGSRIDAEGRKLLQALQDQSTRASRLVEDLLRLARIGRAPLQRVDLDLSALAREIADELRSKDSGRSVEWTIVPGMRTRADAGLTRIVLENLLGNAWKFTSKSASARIDVGASEAGFFVRDNGAGFDPAFTDRLFQPFQRLHADHDFAGSGIGLATVARIVQRHGGRIMAQGEEGKGATFTFTLGDFAA
jgi:signal transduction histidine kinase